MSGETKLDPKLWGAARRTAVVLQTHYADRALVKLFAKLAASCPPGYEAMLLMHVPAGTQKPALITDLPHHFVTTPEIRYPAYKAKSGIGAEWHVWKGGNVDLSALHLYRAHPEFDQYWFVEYDVRFSGDWATLFKNFQRSDADFLTTSLRRATVQPNWMHWWTLAPPAAEAMSATATLADHDRICCFMPIFRVSRAGMQAMDQAYRHGWSGHAEVTWPTLINHAGLRVEDLGGDGEFVAAGNRNRYYTNTLDDADLSPGSMAFRPARFWPGSKRNQLWHPVKPLMFKLREDARSATPEWFKNLVRKRKTMPAQTAWSQAIR
jgi:hypothetical protein